MCPILVERPMLMSIKGGEGGCELIGHVETVSSSQTRNVVAIYDHGMWANSQ